MASEQESAEFPTAEHDKDGYCLLSLDGGGVRGLSSLMVLQSLMCSINIGRKKMSLPKAKPCEIFDLIGGTSTGGLIAIMLGRLRMDVDDCINAYLSLSEEIFDEQSLPISLLTSKVKARFDSEKLKSAVQKIIQDKCNLPVDTPLYEEENPVTRVFVCVTSGESKTAKVFRSYGVEDEHIDTDMPTTICDAALATSAATSFFDPVTIGRYKQSYSDGGLTYSNPILQVWTEAQNIWDLKNGAVTEKLKCIVSIGTGSSSTEPLQKTPSVLELSKALVALTTETEKTAETFAKQHRGLNAGPRRYFRFNVEQGLQSVDLAEYRKVNVIADATQNYMTSQRQKEFVAECVANLKHKESRSHKSYHRIYSPSYGSSVICLAVIIAFLLSFLFDSQFYIPNPQNIFTDKSSPKWCIDHRLPIFAVMGKTGAGTSTFINVLGGRDCDNSPPRIDCEGLYSCTSNLTFYKADSGSGEVYLIDTPGFEDVRESNGEETSMSDEDVMFKIFQELAELSNGDKLVKGLIYLHEMTASRFSPLTLKHIELFEHLCGENAFTNVVLVTNKWSSSYADNQKQLAHEQLLISGPWKDMIKMGSQVMQHDGTVQSARRILAILHGKPRIVLPNTTSFVTTPPKDNSIEDSEEDDKAQPSMHRSSLFSFPYLF